MLFKKNMTYVHSLLVFSVILVLIEISEAGYSSYLSSVVRKCKKESGVGDELIHLSMMGKFKPDIDFKEYLYCFSKKVGLMNYDNSMKNDKLEHMAANILGDYSLAAHIREDCDNTLYDTLNTVYYTFKCYITRIREALLDDRMTSEEIEIDLRPYRKRHQRY